MTAASAPTGGAIIWAASIRIWSSDEAAVALGNEGWQAVSRQRAGADTLDFPRGATNKHTIPSRFPEMLDHAGSCWINHFGKINQKSSTTPSRRLPSTFMGDSVGDPVEDLKLVDTTVPASVVSAASVGAAELLTTCAVVALPVVPVALVPMQPGVPALQGV